MGTRLSGKEIADLFHERFLHGRAKYRTATRSWQLDHTPITATGLARIVANSLDTSHSKVINMLEDVTHSLAIRETKQIQDWCKRSDEMPRSDNELKKYLRLLERPGTEPMAQKANETALKQWLWQVKRGTNKLPATWHVALVFWSKENGTGKSYNVRRLLRPLDSHVRHISADDLEEKFGGTMLAKTLVAFLDEFAGADKISAMNLKAIITAKPWDQRAIFSDSGFYAENYTSTLATCNKEPPHGFVDHTGARRFWSIHCNGQSMEDNGKRAAAFDALDIDAIWTAVKTSDPAPQSHADPRITTYMTQIREETLRSKTSLETFLDDRTERCDVNFKLPMKEFMQDYSRYCSETRLRMEPGGYRKIGEDLKSLGIGVVKPGNRVYLKGVCLSTLEAQ